MSGSRGRTAELERARKAEEKAAAKEAELRRKSALWVIIGLAVVAALIGFIVTRPPPPGVVFADLGNQHIPDPADAHAPYNSSPPSSGPHWGGLAQWGESAEPVPPEIFVHNLEDGGIVLAYDCAAGCDEITDGMRATLDDLGVDRLVMTPYSGITDPDGVAHQGAVVAWTRVFYFDDWSEETEETIDQFISLFRYEDHHATG